MIMEFVTQFESKKPELRDKLSKTHPETYHDLFHTVMDTMFGDCPQYEWPDPKRIHKIDDGDYQGTLLFIIAASGYQPDTYWATKIYYGSCSGCDTLQRIRDDNMDGWDKPPNTQQTDDYMTLALHIVQGMKEID